MIFNDEHYFKAEQLALALEIELKRIGRWQNDPLAGDKFDNMGAFGENTMAFEVWIQFILVVRLRQMARKELDFPENSNLGVYAARTIGDDAHAASLRGLLIEVDEFIEGMYTPQPTPINETVTMGSDTIPTVLYTLANTLSQYDSDNLESQLQTFDTFIAILSPTARKNIAELLRKAAADSTNETTCERIKQAVVSILSGGLAAQPYDHEEAMKKYKEEHRKNYPPN